jgi:hypothetical protein
VSYLDGKSCRARVVPNSTTQCNRVHKLQHPTSACSLARRAGRWLNLLAIHPNHLTVDLLTATGNMADSLKPSADYRCVHAIVMLCRIFRSHMSHSGKSPSTIREASHSLLRGELVIALTPFGLYVYYSVLAPHVVHRALIFSPSNDYAFPLTLFCAAVQSATAFPTARQRCTTRRDEKWKANKAGPSYKAGRDSKATIGGTIIVY